MVAFKWRSCSFFLRNRKKGIGDHLDAEEVGPIVSIEGIPSASWWPPCPVGDGSKTSIHWLPPRSLLHFQFAKKLGCTWIMSFLFSMYDFRAICGKMNLGLTCSVHVIIITLNLRGGVKGGEARETWQYDKWGRGGVVLVMGGGGYRGISFFSVGFPWPRHTLWTL